MRVAVVGGGIAGLSAAWELRDRAEVTVFEANHLGGRILTETFDGKPVDCGPDAFITRSPAAVELCSELGLHDLVAPSAGSSMLWWRGRLRPLPDGLVMGVPTRLPAVALSGLLGPLGVLRAGADLLLPRHRLDADLSVRNLVVSRLGAQVADRLVDPLVGSIYAGRTDDLSAEATVPQLLETSRRSRSLLLGLRRMRKANTGSPTFLAPSGGLGSLVDRLCDQLADAGVRFVDLAVTSVARDTPGWRIEPGADQFDGVVLGTGAAIAKRLLGPDAPEGLGLIPTASVAIATLGYAELELPTGINGVLVPNSPDWMTTACSFGSAKWPHWAQPGSTVLRVSTGRDGDSRTSALDDEHLVDRLSGEVGRILGTRQLPRAWRVTRWPDSFPQYRVGHTSLVSRIVADLRRTHPRVTLCGASYQGVGIPACIASGRSAARDLQSARLERR